MSHHDGPSGTLYGVGLGPGDPELVTVKAARVIGAHDATKPLFLYLAFTAPHTPYQAPQEYLDRFAGIADANRRGYAAMISAMAGGPPRKGTCTMRMPAMEVNCAAQSWYELPTPDDP